MVRYLVLASLLIASSAAANTSGGKLGGDEIRKAVSGKRIYLLGSPGRGNPAVLPS